MTRRLVLVSLVVLGLFGVFLFGVLRGQPDRNIRSSLVGRPAPPIDLPLYEPYWAEYGERLRLADYAGERPIVVNFWASWCPPCREEAPQLEAAWREYGDRILLLGVHTQDRDRQAAGRRFIREFGLTFPSVFDNDSAASIDYGVFGLPETYFIDRAGVIRYKHIGPLNPEVLRERIEALL